MKKFMIASVLMALVCISFFSMPANAQLATKKLLTLDAAKKLASAAEAEALKNNWQHRSCNSKSEDGNFV